ncbi:MAG: 3-deoxy-D-manno-octulosonic acid transferase [Chitinophagaceae bacterium]|nr:3-deoxy-D-manno-octulosonic acid transferase [Chitinophagaceae bacterium]
MPELFFYQIFLKIYLLSVAVASLFSKKAKLWLKGRRYVFSYLEKNVKKEESVIWFHCASLGEFEQGRPLLEALKKKYTDHKILLTFFSPSGFEVQKDYAFADYITYLPFDGKKNALRFIRTVSPKLAIFVKYEFWYYYLKYLHEQHIPSLLISAQIRDDMLRSPFYGRFLKKMLGYFHHIFLQNQNAFTALKEHKLSLRVSFGGDTRFDRVWEIKERFEKIPLIEKFTANHPCIIAGSVWPEDVKVLAHVFPFWKSNSGKIILAPHEPEKGIFKKIKNSFENVCFFSTLNDKTDLSGCDCLIIDRFGLLSRLYHYGFCNYIGGGFRKSGIHNVLEAAVYAKPVIFGPYHEKFNEAVELIKEKGAISVRNAEDLQLALTRYLKDERLYDYASKMAGEYVTQRRGSTDIIMQYIQEKRLLTSCSNS